MNAKLLAAESGVSEVQLSRFRHGKQDLYAGALIAALSKAPEEAQEFYLSAVLGRKVQLDLESAIFGLTAVPDATVATVVCDRRVEEQQL